MPERMGWLIAGLMIGMGLWANPGHEPGDPENLALKARASASSEYSKDYLARFACDGVIPEAMGRADVGKAWAVNGATHRTGAELSLVWTSPVTVGEIVYFGRTGWDWKENWKDYEVYLDEGAKPAVAGSLKAGHGPQRIVLPTPKTASKLTLKFLSSHGGPNPGASEIQVYGRRPSERLVGTFYPPGAVPVRTPVPDSPELLARLKAGDLGFHELVVVQRHHITCSHVYTYHCEGQRNGGALLVYDVAGDTMRRLVDSADGQISSCNLSWDGRQILFSWRRDALYQVYVINADGTGLRRLTDGPYHNYDACWLPDGDIAFLSSRRPQAAYCFFTPVGIIYRMHPDGSGQQRLSANYLNDFTPAVLNDGKLIYGRWEYVDRPAIPIQSLWTLNPDGTGLAAFFGNRVLDPATFIEPQAIPGSTKVLCTMTGHNGSCRGAIGIIDPTRGNNAQEAIRNLTPEIRLRGVGVSSNGPRGPYQTPYPVDDRYFLVSYDGTLLLRDYDGTAQTTVLAPSDGIGFYNPRPLRARPRPPVRSPAAAKAHGPWATVLLQDVYNGLEPSVKRGEVKRLAVVEELARVLIDSPGIRRPAFDFQRVVVSCGATYVPKKLWGFVEVAKDGSACFRVPAGRPLYFMALDAQGRAVQRMRSFTHLMPGETQGCVGCHEPRRQSARRPGRPLALDRPPQEIRAPEWGAVGFNYASIVQPVLDRHCVRCHDPQHAPKGVDLTGDRTDYFNVSYETLARGRRVLARRQPGNEVSIDNPYTSWIPTYNGQERNILKIAPKTWGSPVSRLADLVLSGHPDADGKARVHLDRDEQQRIFSWIDLNVPYYGTADTAYPDHQACRRQYPADLDKILAQVAARRCAGCHPAGHKGSPSGIPRKAWVRVTNPQFNAFLLAPLSKAAGGTQVCGKAVFESTEDLDYQALMHSFDPVLKGLQQTPRMDMDGAAPAACCAHLQETGAL